MENKEIIADDEISLKEIILILRRWIIYLFAQWKLILFLSIIGGGIGLRYASNKKPIYKALLTFVLEEGGNKGSGLSAYAGIASQFGINLGGGGGEGVFAGDNMLELLKSRKIIEKTLLSEVNVKGQPKTLAELFIDFNELREKSWAKNESLKGLKFEANADRSKFSLVQDSILGVFCNTIRGNYFTVDKPDKKLSIIAVTCNSPNELFSKLFTEQLTKEVTALYIETKTKKMKDNVAILQQRADSVRKELDEALYGSALLSDQNLNVVKQQAGINKIKKQGEVQLLTTLYGELIKNLELSKFSLMQQTPLIQVIDSPILPLEKVKLRKLTGVMTGAFLAGFVSVLFFLMRKLFADIMA